MKKRVLVAMSGGVDSTVAAALLKEKGFEVIGMTMCFGSACSPEAIEDARRAAHQLGIRHYVVNMQKALQERVIKDFCKEYLSGRTPNPCVRCNQFIKFDALLKKAHALEAPFLATGHYARVVRTKKGCLLKKGRDLKKDQSYFLYRLNQDQLRQVFFPLGPYTKEQVRAMARKWHLAAAEKPGSQEICFLPGNDYRAFLQERVPGKIKPGLIVDKQGKVLGRHQGIANYTIGQREGLGIAAGYPIYITKIDSANNQITVGPWPEAFHKGFLAEDIHFIGTPVKKKVAVQVRIRYNHKQARAQIYPLKNTIRVRFQKAQFAITPGQSAVFYERDIVLGGGIIREVLD